MRVVDEETFNDTDLETKAPHDQEDARPLDEGSTRPVDEESAPPPPPLQRAPLPEPIPEEEPEFILVKPKRKPRKPKEVKEDLEKGRVLVPALEKPPEAFKETSKLRKDRLKEQIECPNGCGKKITRHAASYTHDKHCQALKKKDAEVDCYEPGFHEKEAAKLEAKAVRIAPEVPPNVEFVERVRQAAWAWHELEKQKHGMLVRQYYKR